MKTLLERRQLETELVPGPVDYRVLRPEGGGSGLPLLLLLHGGGGDDAFLEAARPILEHAWEAGTLPPAVVATPAAGRSFYLDWRDGSQRWESFLLDELLPRLHREEALATARDRVLVAGISMGGMGALRLAFKHPERFGAVAALEPGIESALRWRDVPARDRPYREREAMEERFGRPLDEDYWEANHPPALARKHGPRLAAHGLAIYLEAGDQDRFNLNFGAETLHRVLFEQGLSHEYRQVRGADHMGESLGPRLYDALVFLGGVLGAPSRIPRLAGGPSLAAFRRMADHVETAVGFDRTLQVEHGEVRIHVRTLGDGPRVVLLPSAGRGAADFEDLARVLAREGYCAVMPEPRGFGESTGPLGELTLHDWAADVAAVIRAVGGVPVTLVGHALGNRIARMTATAYPELVARVALFAAGGKVAPAPEVTRDLERAFDTALPRDERLASIGRAFFAPGNDPVVWEHGWNGLVALVQGAANRATPVDAWWDAGGKPLLVVQGEDDPVAPPANAELLAQAHPDRTTLVALPRASHAMLPEQPEALAAALLGWMRSGAA